jgi:hypothetical protein
VNAIIPCFDHFRYVNGRKNKYYVVVVLQLCPYETWIIFGLSDTIRPGIIKAEYFFKEFNAMTLQYSGTLALSSTYVYDIYMCTRS